MVPSVEVNLSQSATKGYTTIPRYKAIVKQQIMMLTFKQCSNYSMYWCLLGTLAHSLVVGLDLRHS